MKLKLRSIKGFSLPELITVVVVIAILGAIALGVVTNLTTQAKANAGIANAATLSRMVAQLSAAGSTFATGAAVGNVDTTSAVSMIGSLNTGVSVAGMTFKMQPTIQTPASYTAAVLGATTIFGFTAGATP